MKSFDIGGTGKLLHFLHANGYPPDCYKPLLDLLKTQYHVFGMLLRPLWDNSKPEEIQDWKPFSDDLLQFLTSYNEPVVGVGHSIGAIVTLRAALRDQSKFRALILIDPVLYIPAFMVMHKITRVLRLGDPTRPLIAGTLRRRRHFDDLETVFKGYRTRRVFSYMSNESLQAYIEGIAKPSASGGFDLVFPPEWEAQIYRTGMRDFDIWRNLPKLKVPTLFIRGAETNTFLKNAARSVKQKQPKVRVEVLEKSTHILPLERPKEVSEIMQSFLKEVL